MVCAMSGDEVSIVTHTDLDGVASAALIVRYLRSNGVSDFNVMFSQPHSLHRVLRRVDCRELYITDLGISSGTYDDVIAEIKRLRSGGTVIYWFDHHVWEDAWVSSLRDLGVNLYIDRGTCAAGVVVKVLRISDATSVRLASATCSNDLWLFNDPLGNFLVRYVACREGSRWRRHLVMKLSEFNGILDDEILKCVEEVVDRDLRRFNNVISKAQIIEVNGIRMAFLLKDWEDGLTSYIANYVMSREEVDVAVVCREGSISLRSRWLNVRDLAHKLGGGGHPRAAGASFKVPLLYKILLLLNIRKPLLRYCMRRVVRAVAGGSPP